LVSKKAEFLSATKSGQELLMLELKGKLKHYQLETEDDNLNLVR